MSTRQVNIWIALRTTAHEAIKTAINTDRDEYTGPVPNWVRRLFETIGDRGAPERIFRMDRVWFTQGAMWRNWRCWSVNFDESRETLQQLGERLDDLVTQYPGQVKILGAWWWDGRQVGTRWQTDDHISTVGTPVYPLDERILEFMPDDDDQGTRPIAPKDVNLIFGQAPRRFS